MEAHILELLDKNFSCLNHTQKGKKVRGNPMDKEWMETRRRMSQKIENIGKEMEIIKRNQTEIRLNPSQNPCWNLIPKGRWNFWGTGGPSWIGLHACSVSHVWILFDPMDCSPPCSSVHGIFQARILRWVAISSSRGSSWPRYQTRISCIGRQVLYNWTTREAPRIGLVPV